MGYVRAENFFAGSAQRVEEAVNDLQTQGAEALIFDMRGNGGGYLDELIPMLDFLLSEGPIFQTRSFAGVEKTYESDEAFVDLPMAVLVNADTYSAAEIFAAELQEEGGRGGGGTNQRKGILPAALYTGQRRRGGGVHCGVFYRGRGEPDRHRPDAG